MTNLNTPKLSESKTETLELPETKAPKGAAKSLGEKLEEMSIFPTTMDEISEEGTMNIVEKLTELINENLSKGILNSWGSGIDKSFSEDGSVSGMLRLGLEPYSKSGEEIIKFLNSKDIIQDYTLELEHPINEDSEKPDKFLLFKFIPKKGLEKPNKNEYTLTNPNLKNYKETLAKLGINVVDGRKEWEEAVKNGDAEPFDGDVYGIENSKLYEVYSGDGNEKYDIGNGMVFSIEPNDNLNIKVLDNGDIIINSLNSSTGNIDFTLYIKKIKKIDEVNIGKIKEQLKSINGYGVDKLLKNADNSGLLNDFINFIGTKLGYDGGKLNYTGLRSSVFNIGNNPCNLLNMSYKNKTLIFPNKSNFDNFESFFEELGKIN